MIKASPLLLIGLILFLWARGMKHEDHIVVGMGKNGRIELRSAAAAVSVSASQGLHRLGKWFSFEYKTRIIEAAKHPHTGFLATAKAAFDWQLRIPLLAVMAVIILGLVILMRLYKPRGA